MVGDDLRSLDIPLTGGRRALHHALLVTLAWTALVGAVVSQLDGYLMYDRAAGLVETRPAGGPFPMIWCGATAALLLAALLRPGRRFARWIGLALLAWSVVVTIYVAATFSLEFSDDETIALWPTRVLPWSVGTVYLAGPLVLVPLAVLYRLERRHRRAAAAAGTVPPARAIRGL